MVTNLNYGRRGKKQQFETGTREVSSTYGRPQTPSSNRKSGNNAPYNVDGPAEQLVARILDIEPEVVAFRPQAITVDLIEGELLYTAAQVKEARSKYAGLTGPQLYTADFLADMTSARQAALEVKLDSWQGDAVYQEKLRLAAQVLGQAGIEFSRILVPSDPDHPLAGNIWKIHQAIERKDLWPTDKQLQQIWTIGNEGVDTAAAFMHRLGLSINLLPVLIGAGALRVDLLAGLLKGSTHVAVAYGDLEHLQLLKRLKA